MVKTALAALPLLAQAEAQLGQSCHGRQILAVAGGREDWPHHDMESLSCNGLADRSAERCCPAAPAEQVTAWLQLALDHNRQQLSSLEVAISNTLEMKEQLQDDCRDIQEALLVPRAGALKVMLEGALNALESVGHLVLAGLCRFCYQADEQDVAALKEEAAAEHIVDTLAKFQRLQENIFRSAVEVAALDLERRCVPQYIAEQLSGIPVKMAEVLPESVEDLLRWPVARRLQDPALARQAVVEERFAEDFYEGAERLLSAILAAPARLGHQLNLLCLSASPRNHWSVSQPTARILWGPAPELQGLGSDEEVEIGPAKSAEPLKERAANESDPTPDPEAAMGLIVLISNHTSEQTVKELANRLEGPNCLFLEDSCGTALEALGYNCHSAQNSQRKCLHPTHVSALAVTKDSWSNGLHPHFAWRRHAATRSTAHSAWQLGLSIWGPTASVWLMDFRPEAACPGLPLAAAVESVPAARLQIVKDPQVLFGMDPLSVQPQIAREGRSQPQTEPSAFPPRTPLAVRISKYGAFHEAAVAKLGWRSSGRRGEPTPHEDEDKTKILVYSCQPFAQCGGHGDRLNGIITVFLLAVLTDRAFFIDSESPLPLQLLLQPRGIDWRVFGGLQATAGLRHISYHDKRWQFEADLEKLAASEEEMIVINMNYRMIRSLFEAPTLGRAARKLGLPTSAPPFLAAEIFDVLFAPTQLLRQELHSLRTELALLGSASFIAIHLRTGQIAWDPARHDSPDELQVFLDCAAKAEQSLGLGSLPWLLATDSTAIAERAGELPEAKSGKLRMPQARGRVHIDRSGLDETLDGAAANFAEWMLFGRASAVVLSRSYFGETAAEVGRVGHAYFAPGGGCVRMDLSSS